MTMRIAFMGSPDFAVPALEALLAAGHQVACVYSQPPRPGARLAGDIHVTAELDHEIVKTALKKDVAGSIDGVAFPDAAEINDHAFPMNKRRSGLFVHFQRAKIDQLSAAGHFMRIRNRPVLVLVIELP